MPPREVFPLRNLTKLLLALTLGVLPAAAWAGGLHPVATFRDDFAAYARPRTLTILATGAVAAAASLSIENSGKEADFLEHHGLDNPSDFGNEYGSGVTLAALTGVLWGAGQLAHDASLKRTGSEMFRSLAYTTAAVTTLKVAFHRKRPDGGAYSFPSGHTAAAFAVAPVLQRQFGSAAGIPAYVLAGMTGMGRMEDRKHYLSDVVFGAALGLSIGVAVSGHDLLPPRLSLQASPGGAGLTYNF